MKKYLMGACLTLMVVTAIPSYVRAEATTTSSSADLTVMLELLQSLVAQVEALQKQLATLKGEIRDEIQAGLEEGMEDDDIKKIQELLATDPTIYPKGIVSGYYGPLTTEAIKRFQQRHELAVTGVVDEETKKLMQEYMKERQNGKFPPGLLTAPGIAKKVMERWRMDDDDKPYLDCSDTTGAGPLCKKVKEKAEKKTKTGVSSTTAALAIEMAKEAIDDLEDAISTASTSDEKDEAEDDLEDAEGKLAEAKSELAKGDYRYAQAKAVEAKKIALRALNELLGNDEDEDDEDENDEDDEDDEDDDAEDDEDEDD